MTIAASDTRFRYTGNGATEAFTVDCKFLEDADLDVMVDGVSKTLNVDYTVTGAGVDAGGTVTFETAPADGAIVVIERNTSLDQGILDLTEGDDFSSEALEGALDKVTMLLQEHGRDLTDVLKADPSDDTALDAEGRRITGLDVGTEDDDAVTKAQMEQALASQSVGPAGPAGDNLFSALTETIKTASYAIVSADRAKHLVANKATAMTFSLPAAADVETYVYFVSNIGVGSLTIDPNGSETIEGAEVLGLETNDKAILVSTGTAWRAFVFRAAGQVDAETTVASAATTDIGAAATLRVGLTGDATITSLGTRPRAMRLVRYAGAVTLTHGANLALVGGLSRTVAVGAHSLFISDGTGAWLEAFYSGGGPGVTFGDTGSAIYRYGENDYRWKAGGVDVLKALATGLVAPSNFAFLGELVWSAWTAPASLGADQTDYTLPSNISIVALTADAPRTIHGFTAPNTNRRVLLLNIGAYPITIPDDSATATAANRVRTGDGSAVLHPGKTLDLLYLTQASRWHAMREVTLATTAEILAATAAKILSTDKVEAANAFVPLAFGSDVTVDFSLGRNFELGEANPITSNFTLKSPLNAREGLAGMIRIKQGAAAKTITWESPWRFPGTKPALTTTANKYDDLFYTIRSATGPIISCSLAKNVA